MGQETSNNLNSDEQAKSDIIAVSSGTYLKDKYDSINITGKGALYGAIGGFIVAVMYGKPKFLYTAAGSVIVGGAGYLFNNFIKKQRDGEA